MNISLPRNEWVDLYAEAAIPVGVPLLVENSGYSDIRVAVSPVKPASDSDSYNVLNRENGKRLINSAGDPGAWAFSANIDGKITVSAQQDNGFLPAERAFLREGLGQGINLDAWGTQFVSQNYSLFHGLFTFDVPPSMWLLYEDGTENIDPTSWTAAISVEGALSLASEGGDRMLVSRRHPRYQPNRGLRWSASIFLPNPGADAVRDFGLFTVDDGYFFRLKNSGLYAVRKRAGVIVQEELITVPFEIDLSKGNIYDIQAQVRGVGNIKFFIGSPDTNQPQLVYQFDLLGTLSTLSVEDPSLCVGFRATKNVDDATLICGCVDQSSEGGGIDREQYASALAENVSTLTDTPIIVVRQPTMINGRFNSRDIRFARLVLTSDKKTTFKVWLTRDPTAITGATFAPISIKSGSFIESDSPDMNPAAVRATAVDTTKMRFVTAVTLPAGLEKSIQNPSPESIDYFIVRGDYLVVTATSPNALADAVLEWGEEI